MVDIHGIVERTYLLISGWLLYDLHPQLLRRVRRAITAQGTACRHAHSMLCECPLLTSHLSPNMMDSEPPPPPPDLHYKMSKKIAQLTKVIYQLNAHHDEREDELKSTSAMHDNEIQYVNFLLFTQSLNHSITQPHTLHALPHSLIDSHAPHLPLSSLSYLLFYQ